jgi:hypothetical protein
VDKEKDEIIRILRELIRKNDCETSLEIPEDIGVELHGRIITLWTGTKKYKKKV